MTVHALGALGVQLSLASVNLSRFKDVSDDVLKLLEPPATRKEMAKTYKETYGVWRPPDWDIDDKPDANFLDLPVPAQEDGSTVDPPVHVEAENLVLRLAGVVAPKLWGVSWPASVDRTDAHPAPIMLFLRQGNWPQYKGMFEEAGLGPYPDNFDYASFGLYDQLAYPEHDVFNQPGSKGVPYQVAKAGVDAVTVLPVNSLHQDYGVIESTKQLGRILLELQWFIFQKAGARPPDTLGNTAIGSFSSESTSLRASLRTTTTSGRRSSMTQFAPSTSSTPPPGPSTIVSSPPSRGQGQTSATNGCGSTPQDLWPALQTFAKQLPSPLPKEPFIHNSLDKRLTLGLVSIPTWMGLAQQAIQAQPAKKDEWGYVHHATAATMLTHALSQHIRLESVIAERAAAGPREPFDWSPLQITAGQQWQGLTVKTSRITVGSRARVTVHRAPTGSARRPPPSGMR